MILPFREYGPNGLLNPTPMASRSSLRKNFLTLKLFQKKKVKMALMYMELLQRQERLKRLALHTEEIWKYQRMGLN